MYLKSFEIHGFKSFCDKTTLTFESGITAVVGPNGSGKSNIAEALRWVLGEQSPRSLRCEKKMEEIIFHGAAHRGPLGFAEVSLQLHNQDGFFPVPQNELEITRRLYRSGESEYFINRASVRLKDVLELFMDTGLGRDGYSIIGQGRIGEILSEKSGDRRRVFEEASGISRFRYRREESERKLGAAELNLTRIADKIEELQMQVEPLREQSGKAQAYLTLREELKTWEVTVWIDALEKIRTGFVTVNGGLTDARNQLTAGEFRQKELYSSSEAMGASMERLSVDMESKQETLKGLQSEMAEIESALLVLRNSIEHNQENITRLEAEQTIQSGRGATWEEQRRQRQTHLEEVESSLGRIGAELASVRAAAQALVEQNEDGAAKVDALKALESEAQEAMNQLRTQISSAQTAQVELTAQSETAVQDQTDRVSQANELKEALDAVRKDMEHTEEEMVSLQNVIGGYELRAAARQKKLEQADAEWREAERTLHASESRQKMLAEMERDYEGRSRAVKTVMREAERGSLSGIRGAVSDLIRVDDRYVVAIEIALGSSLSHIVVESEDNAKAGIALLKRSDAGRATFLPMTAISGRTLDETGLEREAGYVGVASELVQFDPAYQNIIESLLGRTVLVENLDAAVNLARARRHRFRIVTLDGQIIAPGGAMTGGSIAKSVGVLSRKNELERLDVQVIECARRVMESEERLSNVKREVAAVNYELEVAQGQKRTLENALLAQRTQWEHTEARHREMQAQVEEIDRRLRQMEERRRAAQVEEETAAAEWERQKALAQDFAAQAAQLAEAQSGRSGQQSRLTESISELAAKLAAGEAERAADRQRLEEYELLFSDALRDQSERAESIRAYEEKNRELSESIDVKTEYLAESAQKVKTAQDELDGILSSRRELEGQRTVIEKQIKDIYEDNLKLEREVARLESRQAAGEAEERAIVDRLWDTYGLTHSGALTMCAPLDNLTAANRRIGELKSEIAALGNPNLGAIEEYERVSERYAYLSEQHGDANRAREELLKIIDDITGEMKQIFAERFALISRHFSETFAEIFGGGLAQLELEDPEDILNCGVEIKAQPPGKRLRSISLLSGGEKSLTAIALYFAIFTVRPAPFCVLDEVDHDLDDVNVARFAQFLQKMSKDKQFVVITHRRGTMEAADILYGVTTEEEGVSKILSMRLDEAQRGAVG